MKRQLESKNADLVLLRNQLNEKLTEEPDIKKMLEDKDREIQK